METQSRALLKLSPIMLGDARGPGEGLAATADTLRNRWRVRWLNADGTWVLADSAVGSNCWSSPAATTDKPAGDLANAPKSTDGRLAVTTVGGVELAVRSGRRSVGTPPRFPGASVVVCRAEAGGWRDVAYADETPETEIVAVSLAATTTHVLAAYLTPAKNGGALCRVVEFAWSALLHSATEAWHRLPKYPLPPGMAGIMAGCHRGALIAAGGANFPDRPPWEGGVKHYYDEIFVLPAGASAWQSAGRLPTKRAYGAMIDLPEGVLLIGGDDGDRVFADALLLSWNGASVEVSTHSTLAAPVTNAAAARVDRAVYLAGGYTTGQPRLSQGYFWCLDLGATPRWTELPSWNGPTRALAVAAASSGAFYLFSGIEFIAVPGKTPVEAAPGVYLRDAHRYHPATGWSVLPEMPWSAIAAPSPAPTTESPARIFILGGVDGRQVGKLPRETILPDDILEFDVAAGRWKLWPEAWPGPVVCIPGVKRGDEWIFVSGETMAGKRTVEAWSWRIPG